MSVRSQSAFLRKAGTLTVWLIIFCIYFLGVYNYVQIRNDTAVSVFLSAAYPDRKGAENILKQERKSEKPYDVCFYADAGLREISAKEGNRQAQAMTVYLKGNPAGYDWQAAALPGSSLAIRFRVVRFCFRDVLILSGKLRTGGRKFWFSGRLLRMIPRRNFFIIVCLSEGEMEKPKKVQ